MQNLTLEEGKHFNRFTNLQESVCLLKYYPAKKWGVCPKEEEYNTPDIYKF